MPFALFGTAGTEDFNYLEMRHLDRTLTTPHRVAVFEGGHVWLSSALAIEAMERMEIQAMKSGRKPRDPAWIEQVFSSRAAACQQKSGKELLLGLEAMAADFEGLKDVSEFMSRAAVLHCDKKVRDTLKKDRAEEENEQRRIDEILSMERQLRVRWHRIASVADASEDSAERRMARRILRGQMMGSGERVKDPDYRAMLAEFRPANLRQ